MKKTFIIIAILFVFKFSYGQTITIIPFSGTFCSGVRIDVNYSTTGAFNEDNVFNLQLSDSNGSFSNPQIIGNSKELSIIGFIPKILTESNKYRLRISSTSPVITSNDNSEDLRINQTPILTTIPSIPYQGDDVTFTIEPRADTNVVLRRANDFWTGNSTLIPFNGISKTLKHHNVYGNEGIYFLNSTINDCSSSLPLFPMPSNPEVNFVVRDKNTSLLSHISSSLRDMILDEKDNIYVRGVFLDKMIIENDTIYSMYGEAPATTTSFIAKFDKSGKKKWLIKYPDFSSEGSSKLAYENGKFYIAGMFGRLLASPPYDDFKITTEDNIELYTKSSYCSYPNDANSPYFRGNYYWVAKFDTSGTFIFHKQISKNAECDPGGFRPIGMYGGATAHPIIKLKNNKLWLNLSNINPGNELTLDNGFAANNLTDMVFIKLDINSGDIIKTEAITNATVNPLSKGVNFHIDSQGDLIVCSINGTRYNGGNYSESMTFGSITVSFNQLELFIAKYSETNGWLWVQKSANYPADIFPNQMDIDNQNNILLQISLNGNGTFSLAGLSKEIICSCSSMVGLIKIGSNGQGIWINTIENVSRQSVNTDRFMSIDAENNIYTLNYDEGADKRVNNDRYSDWSGNGLYVSVFKPTGELKGIFGNIKGAPSIYGGNVILDVSMRLNSQNDIVIAGGFIRDIIIGNKIYSNSRDADKYGYFYGGLPYTQQFFLTSLHNPKSIVLKDITAGNLCSNSQVQVSFETFGSFPAGTKYKAQLIGNGGFISLGESNESPINFIIPDSILSHANSNMFYVRILTSDDKVIGTHNITKYIQAKKNPIVSIVSNSNLSSICINNLAYQYLYGHILNDGVNPNTYQWKRNNQNIGTNTNQFIPTTTSDTGEYTLTVTNNGCTTTSPPYFFTVADYPSATITGNFSVYQGGTASLPITLTGGGPYLLTLSDGQQKTVSGPINTSDFSVSPSVNTSYNLVSVSNACGPGTVNGEAIVTLLQCLANLNLVSPANNVTNGTFDRKAAASNGIINANNQLTGAGTRASYSSKVIILNPGFKADNGTVFSAEIGGCN